MSHSDHEVSVSTSSPVPGGLVHSELNRWLLLEANRWAVAALFSAFVFVAFLLAGWFGVVDPTRDGPVNLLLSVVIAGNLTLVPVTITINQLVLSREFGKPHELRTRDEGVRQLRRDLKALAGVTAIPPEPEAFVRQLIDTIDDRVDAVVDAAAATPGEELRHRANSYQTEAVGATDRAREALRYADFGSYELLYAMLEVNSAWLIETAQFLERDAVTAAPDDPFDELEAALRLFNVTRQYTKTLYAQKEIATLSRLLLYAGFVAVLVASMAMLVYATPINSTAPPRAVAFGFALLATVVFAPLSFLIAYMLRLSTLMSYPPLRNSFITDG